MTPLGRKAIAAIQVEIEHLFGKLENMRYHIEIISNKEKRYSERAASSADQAVGRLNNALVLIDSALSELETIPHDLEDTAQSRNLKSFMDARSSANALCEYLDTAIMCQDLGATDYEENALERANKMLDDISASLGKQPRIIPEPAIIHEENNHEPA